MSTASNSVMQGTPYPESSPMNGALYRGDERAKPQRAESSFLGTIIGRRGSLRSILSQVDAVAGTNTTVLITGETGTNYASTVVRLEIFPFRGLHLRSVNGRSSALTS